MSVLTISACKKEIIITNPDHLDFMDVTLSNGGRDDTSKNITKWGHDVKIYFSGKSTNKITEFTDSVIHQLNVLIDEIEITKVFDDNDANIIVFFGNPEEYKQLEPDAPIKDSDFGFGFYKSKKGKMTSSTAWINTSILIPSEYQAVFTHEITHLIGLTGHSKKADSVISSTVIVTNSKFSVSDELNIRLLYSSQIEPNMDECDVKEVLDKL